MKILVNTISTKKHSGGAFQIANNFVRKTLEHQEIEWEYVVSSDLDAILPDDMKLRANYHVFPTQPDFKGSFKRVRQELKELERKVKPDVVYSITAPSYFTFEAPEVMRFTNPLVTHPNKYSWRVQPWMAKLRLLAYCWNQKRMMRKAHYFVTQTETTKQGILRITGVPESQVCVVKNVLPSIFSACDNTHIDTRDNRNHIACVAAPVPHKNLDIIPDVLKHLNVLGIDNVRIHVTIPQDDAMWQKITQQMRTLGLSNESIINHGRVPQKELAEMYRRCSLCFLPTLLEVFSVSTLEAMFFDLKIVATDFPFNREVLGDAALYYEPMNAKNAAGKLAQLIKDSSLQQELSTRMKRQLSLFSDYDQHFNSIVEFLQSVANRQL